MDYDKLCNDILNLDKNMRFAVVLSKYGEKIAGGFRENVTSLLNPDEMKMSLFYAGQRWDTRANLAHRIGQAKYSMTEYEKIKQFTMPIDDKHLLLLSAEINADHIKIIEGVRNLIKKVTT